MSTNTNLFTTNSQYVSSNMFRNALIGLNSLKNVFPLNLPRANTNYFLYQNLKNKTFTARVFGK